MFRRVMFVSVSVSVLAMAPIRFNATADEPTPVYSYKVVNTYPHDRRAFTQGIVYQDGFLYESIRAARPRWLRPS